MILRKSIGIGGRSASPGAYERIGIISLKPGLKPGLEEKSQADIVTAWFKVAEVMEVKIV